MRINRVICCSILAVIFVISVAGVSVAQEPIYQAGNSCCKNPILGNDVCRESYPGDRHLTLFGCCGEDPGGFCEQNYFLDGVSCQAESSGCSSQLVQGTQGQIGCCLSAQEGCQQVSSEALCQAPNEFRLGACNTLPECTPKCCRCGSTNSCEFAQGGLILPQCEAACAARGLGVLPLTDLSAGDVCECPTNIQNTYRVIGHVKEVSGGVVGSGVRGAQVEIIGRTPENTRSDGAFEIFTVPPGVYAIRASAEGYFDNYTTVTVTDSDLNVSQAYGDLLLASSSVGTVSGRVESRGVGVNMFMVVVTPVFGITQSYPSNYMFFNGYYEIDLPIEPVNPGEDVVYTVDVVAPGYNDVPAATVTFVSGGDTDLVQPFDLTRTPTGSVFFIVTDAPGSLTPVGGVTITLETMQSCITNDAGRCTITDVTEGIHKYSAFKDELHSSIVDKSIDVVTGGVFTESLSIALQSELCSVPITSTDIHYFLEGTCSPSYKPYFCDDGNTMDPSSQDIDTAKCFGPDGIANNYVCEKQKGGLDVPCSPQNDYDCSEFATGIIGGLGRCVTDDCGCPERHICLPNGHCVESQCEADCTFTTDSICHAECEGVNGCSFYDANSLNVCDGEGLNERVPYNSSQTVLCCSAGPSTDLLDESNDCTDGNDNDGDGYIDCADTDCFDKKCDANDDSKTCRVKDYVIDCYAPSCPTGVALDSTSGPSNDGCLCGSNTYRTGDAENICCEMDGMLYDSAGYDASPCGSTNACTLAGNVCCVGGCSLTSTSLSSDPQFANACGAVGTCCPSGSTCWSNPPFACDFEDLCPIGERVAAPNVASLAGKFGCNVQCLDIPYCTPNRLLHSRSNPLGICQCSTTLVDDTSASQYAGRKCCTQDALTTVCDANGRCELSLPGVDRCPYAALTGTLQGVVRNSVTNDPVTDVISIYIDGVYKGSTQSDGTFVFDDVDLDPFGRLRRVHAKFGGYHDSQSVDFSIVNVGDIASVELFLRPLEHPCRADQLFDVDNFNATHILGDVKKANLTWVPPLCDNKVAYEVWRTPVDNCASFDPLNQPPSLGTFLGSFSTSTQQMVDDFSDYIVDPDAPYETTFTYYIKVLYDNGRESGGTCVSIEIGDKECEGRYRENGDFFEQFCLRDIGLSDEYGFTTCENNKVRDQLLGACSPACDSCPPTHKDYPNCPQPPGTPACKKCSGPNDIGQVECKAANICGPFGQNSFPFGLFYERDACLGASSSNYCYYDYYASSVPQFNALNPTPVDRCLNCGSVSSCFSYKSQDACSTDNCGVGGGECEWVDLPYGEFGAGLCTPKQYEGTGKCQLCGDYLHQDLFFNTECSQDVCDALGDCFSYNHGQKCQACDTMTCEDYVTEETCTGGQPFTITADTYVASNDACGIGKCRWDSTRRGPLHDEPFCFKDGDSNVNGGPSAVGSDDCRDQLSAAGMTQFKTECISDLSAPETVIVDEYGRRGDFRFFGGLNNEIRFTTEHVLEQNPSDVFLWPKHFYYCVTDDEDDHCNLQAVHPDVSRFGNVPYPTSGFITLSHNWIASYLMSDYNSEPGNYYLKFYSVDHAFNQEEVQSVMFYADIRLPDISLTHTVVEGDPDQLRDPRQVESQVNLQLITDEEIWCVDRLENTRNQGTSVASRFDGNARISGLIDYSFADLPDGTYNYYLTCEDILGNSVNYCEGTNGHNPECIIFIDAFKGITVLDPAPHSVVTGDNPTFRVSLSDNPTACRIVDEDAPGPNREFALAFESNPSSTEWIYSCGPSALVPCPGVLNYQDGHHYDNLYVECDASVGSLQFPPEQFIFTHDNTPPDTSIIVREEGNRAGREETFDSTDWAVSFNTNVEVEVVCEDPLYGPGSFVSGVSESGKLGCSIVPDGITNTCTPTLPYTDVQSGVLPTEEGEQIICYRCEDLGGVKGLIQCGSVTRDTTAPTFSVVVKNSTDDEVTTLIRGEEYTAFIDSSELLSDSPNFTFSVNGVVYDRSFELTNLFTLQTSIKFSGTFSLPPATPGGLFEDLTDADDVKFVIVNGVDRAENMGSVITQGEAITVDTTAPLAPAIYDLSPLNQYYSSDPTFDVRGAESDGVGDRGVVVLSSTSSAVQRDLVDNIIKFIPDNLGICVILGTCLNPPDAIIPAETRTVSSPTSTVLYSGTLYTTPAADTVIQMNPLPTGIDHTSFVGKYVLFTDPLLQDPTGPFYEIASHNPNVPAPLAGVQTYILSTALDGDLSQYNGASFEVHDQPRASGQFSLTIPLDHGPNYFYLYAIDEVGNSGDTTDLYRVIYDDVEPRVVFMTPSDESITSQDLTILISLEDMTSGINLNTLELFVDENNFTCISPELECVHALSQVTDRSLLTLPVNGLEAGGHDINFTVDDLAGNTLEFKSEFTANDTLSKQISFTTPLGNCVPGGQCHVQSDQPSFNLTFDFPVLSLTAIFHSSHGVAGTVEDRGAGEFNISASSPLAEGSHYLEVEIDVAGGPPATLRFDFVIDSTPPQLDVASHLIERVSNRDIDVSGTYVEENVESIDLTGEVARAVSVSSIDLETTHIVDLTSAFVVRDLPLDVSTSTETKEITVTIFDLAGNSASETVTVVYDTVVPVFTALDIVPMRGSVRGDIDGGFTSSASDISIQGGFDKELSDIRITSPLQQLSIGNGISVNATEMTFNATIELTESQEEFTVVIEDLAGNTNSSQFTIDLDTVAPRPIVRWI